jgi:hypothetical protein
MAQTVPEGRVRIRVVRDLPIAHPRHVQFGQRLGDVETPPGLGTYEELFDELLDMLHVLQGRADAPVSSPYLGLMEVATAYIARAFEIEMLLLQLEHEGDHALQKFRTGPLRSFIDAARKMVDLGSRRLTQEQILSDMRRDAGEI